MDRPLCISRVVIISVVEKPRFKKLIRFWEQILFRSEDSFGKLVIRNSDVRIWFWLMLKGHLLRKVGSAYRELYCMHVAVDCKLVIRLVIWIRLLEHYSCGGLACFLVVRGVSPGCRLFSRASMAGVLLRRASMLKIGL